MIFLTNGSGTTAYLYVKHQPILHTIEKKYKMDIDLNVKPKPSKLLEKKVGTNLSFFAGDRQSFLDRKPKAGSIEQKFIN